GKNSLNRLIRCVCGKKIGPDPRNFNQRVSLGRNDLLIRTFPKRLVWSATEIQNKEVPLVATIRETKVNSMTVGDFEATATFEFSYE
ncbi:hypothetical protein ABKU48_15840, partial [Enterobacter hormaechei]